MSSEPLLPPSEALPESHHPSRRCGEPAWIFEELPTATIVSVSRPETGDISPILLSYTIELQYVPSVAALSIIRPSIGGQQTIADRAKVAMQGYLNRFLGNLDIVNSQEVCRFLEVSRLSFLQEYGPKLKEGYVMVKHLSNISQDSDVSCFPCNWFHCCNNSWKKVWSVLKPGFLAFLDDPFNNKPLDIMIFDILPYSNGDGGTKIFLADPVKERNPLRYTFKSVKSN
ncbi:Phospholipase D p1 [Glycine soja]|nr:Phospholipase D p1 [Glycine soja]